MDGASLTGRLVVATASLADPNFALTAALILEHGEQGALGIVLNRPGSIEVEQVVPGWSAAVTEPQVVFIGGPVMPSTVIAVGRRADDPPPGWQPIFSEIGVVDLGADPVLVAPGLRALRLFSGYAGWASGQLESEIESGAWFVIDATPEDPFWAEPPELWRRVLTRQGGLFRTIAADPTAN
ncbi:MAG: YqgE/AlgH family protein [Egibacteraceae bacterium]